MITITSDNAPRVESMAACLLAEFAGTTWGRAMQHLEGADGMLDTIYPGERAIWRRMARYAIDHIPYLVIEEREAMLDAEIGRP
jgi:hypothetical protein